MRVWFPKIDRGKGVFYPKILYKIGEKNVKKDPGRGVILKLRIYGCKIYTLRVDYLMGWGCVFVLL